MSKIWNRDMLPVESLTEALGLDLRKKYRIAAVGGGGKTATLYRLARELTQAGKRVIITTTTHMMKPLGIPFVLDCDIPQIQEMLDRYGLVMTGWQDPENEKKISAVTANSLDLFQELADVVLVEADGAKHMPLKAPTVWEPALVELCDLVLILGGIDALGKTFRETCFRPILTSGLCGKKPEDRVMPEDLAAVCCHPQGGKKNISGQYRILINKVDGEAEKILAERVAEAFQKRGEEVYFTSHKEKTAVILLAAGNSTRFQENKLLYPVQGKKMYLYALELIRQLPADRKILVTQYPEILEAMGNDGILAVENLNPEAGISRSLQLGIQAAGEVDDYLFLVCDQPRLKLSTVEALMDLHQVMGGITAVSRKGKNGNPCMFSARYRDELMAIRGDVGGRQVMKQHPEQVTLLEVEDPAELSDIDTKDMLEEIR